MTYKVPDFDREEFTKDWNDNRLTILEVAAKYGMSTSSVSNYVRRFSLPPRPRGSKVGRGSNGEEIRLSGGEWVRDSRGVMRWVEK